MIGVKDITLQLVRGGLETHLSTTRPSLLPCQEATSTMTWPTGTSSPIITSPAANGEPTNIGKKRTAPTLRTELCDTSVPDQPLVCGEMVRIQRGEPHRRIPRTMYLGTFLTLIGGALMKKVEKRPNKSLLNKYHYAYHFSFSSQR